MEFILLGDTDDDQLRYVLFTVLLVTHTLTLTGNILIITIALVNRHLQTPMYFLLRNFSVLEIGFITTVIPKALATLPLGKNPNFFRGLSQSNFSLLHAMYH